MSIFGPLDNLLRAYGDLQARLQTAEADLAAAREREQRLVRAWNLVSWMAEAWARGGGSSGPEMQDYKTAADLFAAAAPSAVAQKPRGEGV